jgi:hypothetical protein
MVSSEVQRTLVKSPPELWAELSDPASLARHLGELGEIRITRVEPERTVEWEGEDISGTVLLKPSGWGTKVTLAVTREVPEPGAGLTHAPDLGPEPGASAPPAAEEPGPTLVAEPELESAMQPSFESLAPAEPEAEEQAEPESEQAEPESEQAEPETPTRRGFFSRLFRRGRRAQLLDPERYQEEELEPLGPPGRPDEEMARDAWELEPHELPAAETHAALAHTSPTAEEQRDAVAEPAHEGNDTTPAHLVEPAEEAGADPAESPPEPAAAEEAAAEEVEAVLTAVLDRLGAAHHRPFSRA